MTTDGALEALSTYGYALLFSAAAAEHTFVLGLLVPGDVIVVLGGVLAEQGAMNIGWAFAVVLAGVLLGLHASYLLGRYGGIPLLERWGARMGLTPVRIKAVESYFAHHGAKTVFFSAFIAGIKNLVPALAGASRMSYPRFLVYGFAGGVLRAAAALAIGWIFGASIDKAMAWFGRANAVAGAIVGAVVIAVAGYWIWRRKKRRGEGE